jgi:hypothetical protein
MAADGDAVEDGHLIEIANEYTAVRISKVSTAHGHRLRIEAPRTGHSILLDAMELESLTWQSHDVFSGFLEEPFGPHP